MVYHYSDGTLEYEEHFNASNVLQEVLKYSYDADGNVEYLLYKDDNFSNANAYDLYYYVRDAVGNITDLFQIREQSGSSTAVVNRIAAHYEYDPYGNILSVDRYNNDPIGDINPIRYKDYYYDLQTGWYQLSSRFYDPEVGRFLNADDLSLITETDSGVIDKNLYAYCDGNPVMRKDDGGDCWQIIAGVFGGIIGAGFEIGYQMIIEHKSVNELNGAAIFGAAVNGAATGAFGPLGATAASAICTATTDLIVNRKDLAKHPASTLVKAGADTLVSAALTYVCGGGHGAGKSLIKSINIKGFKKGISSYTKSAHNALKNQTKKWKQKWKAIGKRSFWGLYSTQKYYFYYSAKHYLWH